MERTVAQWVPTSVTIPTSPLSAITLLSTRIPSADPRLIINVSYQFPGSLDIISAATFGYSVYCWSRLYICCNLTYSVWSWISLLFCSVRLSTCAFKFSFSLRISSLSRIRSCIPVRTELILLMLFSNGTITIPAASCNGAVVTPEANVAAIQLTQKIVIMARRCLLFNWILKRTFFFRFFMMHP